jgi:hypothetical protein
MYPKVQYIRDSVIKLFPVIEHREMVENEEADSSVEISKGRDSVLYKHKV